jgi:hypothetical protein
MRARTTSSSPAKFRVEKSVMDGSMTPLLEVVFVTFGKAVDLHEDDVAIINGWPCLNKFSTV